MDPTLSDNQKELISKRLKDRFWRLENLYYVMDESGKAVKFKLRPEQKQFFDKMWYLNIVLKARQLGFTTFIQIFMLDHALFNPNTSCGIIAHVKEDAEKFMHDKIKFAYDNLPDFVKAGVTITKSNEEILRFSNGSKIQVGTSLRGGTFQILHISEHGKLCAKHPDKAKEVRLGALNTVHPGSMIFIESTAEGNTGDFYDFCTRAQQLAEMGTKLTRLDFKFHFFPWWQKKEYREKEEVAVPARLKEYFIELRDKYKISLSKAQKSWYVKKEAMMGEDMRQEFPSYPEEAFNASIEGAYFKRQMASLRIRRRITEVPHVPHLPVLTFWDIGRDTTSIWFFQDYNGQYRFFDYYQNSGEGLEFYINVLRNRGLDHGIVYNYGTCYLPHDGGYRKSMLDRQTPEDRMYEAGFDVVSVPRTPNKDLSIQKARETLPLCWFDEEACDTGIKGLDNYRKEWDEKLGTWKNKPRHDAASHVADAFMTFADGYHQEFVEEEQEEYYHAMSANEVTGY